MKAVVIGSRNLRECPSCEGLWVDTLSLEQICADREKQAAILGWTAPAGPTESGAIEKNIRYLPCPECKGLMNRVNFANYSNVVVDVCKAHGTWFDRDELRRIIEFIRGGGMDSARAGELAQLGDRRRQLKAAQTAGAWSSPSTSPTFDHTEREFGLSTVAALLKSFLQ
jgi:Zn-finger nucleic acid-binding protein